LIIIIIKLKRGKCRVFHFEDILEAKNFKPFADTFFCILTYNPEARRLANIQGEIRVGASHQVKLPPCQTYRNDKELTDLCNSWEHCMWKCKKIKDSSLYTYLQAARSVAALAGICDRGSMDDMYEAAQCDTTSLHAMTVLHDTGYDTEKALKVLVKTNQTSKMFEKKWCEEDQKKFVKGLSQFGKNFFRIRKELLPHKETSQIIEFYYLWKKTSSAQQNRFRRRIRPSSTKKLTQTKKNLGQTTINSEINGQTNSQNNNNTNNSNNNPNNGI
jgi:arginine-glutamic acid dipeptide repeats protein